MTGPKMNSIYRIADLEISPFVSTEGVTLVGLAFKEFPCRYFVHLLFRPLQEKPKKTSIAIFKKLQTSNKITEPV